MPTRKELIASGVEITPLTREEILLQGGEIEPLNVKERVLQGVVGGGVTPEGTITITQNGTGIDVAQYATADVNVSGGSVTLGSATVENNTSGNISVRQLYINNGSLSIGPVSLLPSEQKTFGVANTTYFETYLEVLTSASQISSITVSGASTVLDITDKRKVVGVKNGDTITVSAGGGK